MSLAIICWSTISLCGFTFFACKSTVEAEVSLVEASCTIIQIMEQINFEQSLKNIPVPDDKSYHELFIVAMEKTIKAFRNKAAVFVSKNKKQKNLKRHLEFHHYIILKLYLSLRTLKMTLLI